MQASVRGVEKKPLPHLLCTTNMLLHGIDIPSNIRHDNTLARPLRDYGPKDRVDVILTNPPFGGMEEDGIESNSPKMFQTRETADLFLLLIMHVLKPGGRAAIVLTDGTMFGEGVKTRIKERLLDECNLHTVVRLPPSHGPGIGLLRIPNSWLSLERRGRERGLMYKTALLTGLRRGELASITIGDLCFDTTPAYLNLRAAEAKNRENADLPLRADLAKDLQGWIADILLATQDEDQELRPSGLTGMLPDNEFRARNWQDCRHPPVSGAETAFPDSRSRSSGGWNPEDRRTGAAGAMELLPQFTLGASPEEHSDAVRATGTDDGPDGLLAPTLAPADDNLVQARSDPDKMVKNGKTEDADQAFVVSLSDIKRKQPQSSGDRGCFPHFFVF